jgi:hypothetical protein
MSTDTLIADRIEIADPFTRFARLLDGRRSEDADTSTPTMWRCTRRAGANSAASTRSSAICDRLRSTPEIESM